MDKIIVFGATGGTGRQVVEQALRAGHQVKVVVRQPETFNISNPNLKIIKGDVLQPDTFEDQFIDADAVISCLGIPKVQPTTLYSESMENIITAMEKTKAKRIICISSGAIDIPPKSSFIMTFLLKNVLQRIYKPVYKDMKLMESKLKSSKLNYTVVRAPKLTNGKKTGKYREVTKQPLRKIPTISRADLAAYMLKTVNDPKSYKSIIEVAY
ncbi:NAD(P)-dependent oxidoreductase [Arcticibacter eurypsychrophilus]|uniref:NAD(P)-dependent oxidoreductase n=1 Tax=Arcticibacter eurypsychrophilus TaxID=1434752 RepID=UPI00084DCBEF|nr:SDR family oxidoreductase [Arcticibacter eurypsychrophilus]